MNKHYENLAHNAIIAWCRSDKRKPGVAGHPVMRIPYHPPGTPDKYFVFDLNKRVPKEGSSWEMTDKVLASGDSWEHCLAKLQCLDGQWFDGWFAKELV